jgi:hypothetical protein
LEQKTQNSTPIPSTPIPIAYAAQGRSKGGRDMSAIVAEDLGTLPLIVLKNSAIIVRKQGISSKILPSGLQRNLKLLIMSQLVPQMLLVLVSLLLLLKWSNK